MLKFLRRKQYEPQNGETKKSFTLNVLNSFVKFFLSVSTIHGFNHLTAEKRHAIEVIIWLSLVGAAVYGAGVLSSKTWTRYQENPTVISMERDRLSWNTSFPSATICPTYKLSNDFLNAYIENSTAGNKTALKEFLVSLAEANFTNMDTVVPYDGISSDQYMQLLVDLAFTFKPTVSNSEINGYKYYIQKTVTEMGVCYSYNSNLAIYNSPDYRKKNRWDLVQGIQTFFVHPLDGEVFANIVNMSTGFHMYLHGPFEVPDMSSKNLYSPNGFFLQIYLTGLTIISSDRLRSLTAAQRKCRFYDESDLHHSPVYSYTFCRMECRAVLSKQLCGCVPHFYRKLAGERTCDVDGLHCLSKHKDRIIPIKECNCLPNCEDVNFVVEDLDMREWFLGSNLQWGLKEYPRMRLKRDVLFGFTDLLVYIGGMAGLFLGCSVLSFIEIFYFFTIRLFWFVIKYGKSTKEMMQIN